MEQVSSAVLGRRFGMDVGIYILQKGFLTGQTHDEHVVFVDLTVEFLFPYVGKLSQETLHTVFRIVFSGFRNRTIEQ